MSGLFTTPQSQLSKESWRLMLRKKTELEKLKEKQKKLLQEIFGK
jgi:hypothetical protein